LHGILADLDAWVGFFPSSPQQGVKYKLCYLDFFGGLYISHEKLPKDGKVLSHWGLRSKVLHRPLTDLSAWWDSAPQANSRMSNINFDIQNVVLFLAGGAINIP